jgi:hypothetical protein
MVQFEGLEARTEYTIWYDNGDGDVGTVEFDNLESVEEFRKFNNVLKEERFVGNLE